MGTRWSGRHMGLRLWRSMNRASITEIMKIDPAARVVMVTAMSQQIIAISALKAGGRDFVVKSFDAE